MQKWKIGDVTVTKLVEIERPHQPESILQSATRENLKEIEWLSPHFITPDGDLILSHHALIVETPDQKIMVDTCIGNDKFRSLPEYDNFQTSFLRDLEEIGILRESISTVMCTHLHLDHVGWNTILENDSWVPTFPKARYLFAQNEFEYWRDQDHDPIHEQVFADSVRPIFDAGLADLVSLDHQICNEIRLIPTTGHTPGHVSVMISSNNEHALITGDFVHHPCQMKHLDWANVIDFDSEESTKTRQDIFERFAETPTLIIGTHFAGVTAGRLRRDGDAFRLDY